MATDQPGVSFGTLLRQLRTTANLTQEELAGAAGISHRSVSDLERAIHRTARKETAQLLAGALGLTGQPRALFVAAARGRVPAAQVLTAQQEVAAVEAAVISANADGVRPAAAAAPQVRYSLPTDTAAFTGRADELDRITAVLAQAGMANGVVVVGAIDGMPGVGKTALAVHAAHVLAAEFADRQLFIDLHAHTPGHEPMRPQDALAGLLAAIGVDPRFLPDDLAGRAALWRDRMAGQRALLVLDNAADSGQVAPLLPGSGGCLVLVTSRRHLGDLPGAVTPVLLDVLSPAEAADMFIRLAPRAAGDRGGVAEVVALAGCLPLAVSLLARVFARHPSWTLADLAAETRAGVLTLAVESDSVAAAFEVSYRHLDPGLRRLFRLLGMHPGAGCDSYAAAALAGIGQADAARLLDGLYREGLLTEAGHRRYGLHDLLRRYARDHADSAGEGEAEQALGRQLDYYQHTAAVAGRWLARRTRPGPAPVAPAGFEVPRLANDSDALAWARANRACLLACLDLVARTGQHDRVVALTAGLADLLRRDGSLDEAVTRHTAAATAAQQIGDRLGEANARTDLGTARWITADYTGAVEAFNQALGIYRQLGSRLGEANALSGLGIMRWMLDDYASAAEILVEALRLYRNLGDRLGEANALKNLGEVREVTGNYAAATEVLAEALRLYRDLGDRLGEAHALTNLGDVRRVTGDYAAAIEALEGALRLYRDLGDRLGEATALNNLGEARRVTGDYPGATEVLEEALRIFRDLASRHNQANALSHLGSARRLTGDWHGAAGALEEALGIYRDLGDRLGEADACNEQGALHGVRGDLVQAERCYQRALDVARGIGSSLDEARALAGLGYGASAAGRTSQAESLLWQAHELFQRIGAAEASDVRTALHALARPGSLTADGAL